MFDHAACPGFGVGHQLLIGHLEDLAWEQAVPVGHQPLVIQQLFTDPLPVVGKAHAAELGAVIGEEIGDGDVTRLTPHVNHRSVGKQQLDQANVLEVVGQFVHHPLGSWLKRLQRLQQPLAVALAFGCREIPEAIGVGQSAAELPFPGLHSGDLLADLAQFTGAVHLRMAAENLLGEGGAGARHAEHEHRQQ